MIKLIKLNHYTHNRRRYDFYFCKIVYVNPNSIIKIIKQIEDTDLFYVVYLSDNTKILCKKSELIEKGIIS